MDITLNHFKNVFKEHTPTLQAACKCYAVLVPLIETKNGLSLLYEVRSSNLQHHSSEVCFPGGQMEKNETPVQCAIRETKEELGLDKTSIDILGQLDFLYLRSDGLMYPILASIKSESISTLHINPSEVANVFTIPISWLQNHPPEIFHYKLKPMISKDFPYASVGVTPDYHWAYGNMEIPVYKGLPYPLWGLTARITYWLISQSKICQAN